MFSTSGAHTVGPSTENAHARTIAHSGDDVLPEKPSGDTPQTPDASRFLASAMWMYVSSSG